MKVPLLLRIASSFSIALAVFTSHAAAADDAPKLPPPAQRPVDFAKDVRPILEGRCTKCHGPKKQEGGFRLDDPAAAKKGGDAGGDLVPGESAKSLLILAVAGATDEVSKMPEKGEPLSAEQIGILRAWIDQGAKWPATTATQAKDPRDHWAFKAPVRPALPEVSNAAWPRNEIDRFVLARLEKENLKPSPEADKVTLLRRLSLDLIGLPPTVAEVDAFLADTSADAYQNQVERLLASPHYGERWGRHWLDAARYADSDGFEKDKSRNVWFYRDWVIAAFNRDLPYDQFLIEQLAGDLLPHATQDQIVATGFLRNSMLNEEGGIDPEQFRMEAMFDRMDCIGKSVLGLTIQCCQCHNHKFDPLTQEDYYRLFAFLNNDHAPQRVVYTPEEMMRRDNVARQIREIEAGLRQRTPDWRQRLEQWSDDVTAAEPAWEVLAPDEYLEVGGGAKLSLLKDQSMLCAGYAPTHCTFRVVGTSKLTRITGVRLELLCDPNLPRGGPGRSFKGTFGLTEIKVEAAPADAPKKKHEIKIAQASADFSQPEAPLDPPFDDRSGKKRVLGPVQFAIDGKNETAWGIDTDAGRRNQDRKAVFQLAAPIEFPAGAIITVSLVQNHGGWNSDDHQNNLLGRFRLSVTAAPPPVVADPLPKRVRDALNVARDARAAVQAGAHTPTAASSAAPAPSPAQTAALFRVWRTNVPEWSEANAKIDALWREWPEGTTALVLEARDEPRTTSVLKRGDFLRPDHPVTAGVPAILHPLPPDAPPTRLSLAHWLADRRSPTTARVFVNRVWQAYFGTGIVSTSEDFGMQSDPPSHPKLLDWMACELMDRGWSTKALHRLIVNSATYRQSSKVSPELHTLDPYNRLLARGPRFRVEGEVVRDVALAASGLLNPKLGGPSIYEPIPESLLALSYAPLTWNTETGPDRYRRAIYTFRRRSLPYPALQNFDTPNGDLACVRRQRSNTPLQALTTLNEVIFVECAQALARKTLVEGGATDEDRIRYAFRRCLSREPSEAERKELLGLMQKQLTRIAEGWLNPREIATGKNELPGDLPKGATPAQLAAYTILARVILNLDETITKE
jgi:mono/diheme cytochrome c family protein